MKPFLKWPGGKLRLVDRICAELRPGRRLIEPFAGSAAVFLNSSYRRYLLADVNADLIDLYRRLVSEGEEFVDYCSRLFTPANNRAERYYRLRSEFNRTRDPRRRSALFLYLNRFCYNGLCRYNSRGEFNTPFGRYEKPYFPRKQMLEFISAGRKARFLHAGFAETMKMARDGDVVYCDPPYTPLNRTSYFTDYHTGGFKWEDQVRLAELAAALRERGVQVVISNHDTREIRALYGGFRGRIESFAVQRNISCLPDRRTPVGELLAVFG